MTEGLKRHIEAFSTRGFQCFPPAQEKLTESWTLLWAQSEHQRRWQLCSVCCDCKPVGKRLTSSKTQQTCCSVVPLPGLRLHRADKSAVRSVFQNAQQLIGNLFAKVRHSLVDGKCWLTAAEGVSSEGKKGQMPLGNSCLSSGVLVHKVVVRFFTCCTWNA